MQCQPPRHAAGRRQGRASWVRSKPRRFDGEAYRRREDAERKISAYIDDIYDARRVHSSLGYKPPIEFEDEFRQAQKREAKQPCPRHRLVVSQPKGAVH